MYKNITIPVVWAVIILGSVPGASQLCAATVGAPAVAQAGAEDEDYRVVAMEKDPAEKGAAAEAGASGAEDWDEIFKTNNYDKLTENDKQAKKAELVEDFDADTLDPERLSDWYGATEECASKGRLPNYKELLKIWDAECKESTSTVCSAVYWTAEKKGEQALGVDFLNGYVVPKDLDAFGYVRCVAGKKGGKPADVKAAAKAGKKKADASSGVPDFVRNYRPMPDGPRLEDKMIVAITGAGGSAGAISWEVKKKGPGLFSAAASVPAGDGEITFTFKVNMEKKTVTPANARAQGIFKAITDPDVEDGDMR